jgi:hypothetical protein
MATAFLRRCVKIAVGAASLPAFRDASTVCGERKTPHTLPLGH